MNEYYAYLSIVSNGAEHGDFLGYGFAPDAIAEVLVEQESLKAESDCGCALYGDVCDASGCRVHGN